MRGIVSTLHGNGHPDPIHHREGSHTPPAASYAATREEPHDTAEPVQILAPPIIQQPAQPSERELKREPSGPVVNVTVHNPAPPAPAPAPAPIQRLTTPPAPVPVPAPPPVPTIVAPSLAPPPIDPNPELQVKLQDAQSEIQRLRALLAAVPDPSSVASTSSGTGPTELRRRHRGPTSDDGMTVVSGSDEGTYRTYVTEEVAPEGVPLQVVIIIAVTVFITTYLFF